MGWITCCTVAGVPRHAVFSGMGWQAFGQNQLTAGGLPHAMVAGLVLRCRFLFVVGPGHRLSAVRGPLAAFGMVVNADSLMCGRFRIAWPMSHGLRSLPAWSCRGVGSRTAMLIDHGALRYRHGAMVRACFGIDPRRCAVPPCVWGMVRSALVRKPMRRGRVPVGGDVGVARRIASGTVTSNPPERSNPSGPRIAGCGMTWKIEHGK